MNNRNVTLVFIILSLALFLLYWLSLTPTITPNDVVLSGQIKKAEFSQQPRYPSEGGYVLEVSLDKKSNKPLYVSDTKYFYDIYPLVDGFYIEVWDFFKGLSENGGPKGGEGYSFGSDGRTIIVAAENIKKSRISGADRLISQLTTNVTGFAYIGDMFPTRVRLYLAPNTSNLSSKSAYLVYSHYEVKWGKSLSWAKLVPIDLSDE